VEKKKIFFCQNFLFLKWEWKIGWGIAKTHFQPYFYYYGDTTITTKNIIKKKNER